MDIYSTTKYVYIHSTEIKFKREFKLLPEISKLFFIKLEFRIGRNQEEDNNFVYRQP